MATYEPPTSNLAIFDPSVFQTNDEPLTIEEAKKRFLTFPVAQGTETLLNTTVNGNLQVDFNAQVNGNFILGSSSDIFLNYGTTLKTVNPAGVDRGLAIGPDTLATQDVNKITFEGGGNDTSLVINNNTNINVNSENSTIIGTNTATALSGSTDFLTNSVVIGSGALSATTGSGEILNTVAIGTNALINAFNSSFTKNNTAIGTLALSNFNDDGMNNTALGYRAGSLAPNFFTGGENNTFLGANTQVNSVLSATYCNHSTALGCDSVITADNQIVLGSSADSVIIPNILTFSDGTSLGSATAIPTTPTTNYFKNFSSTPQTISLIEMISNYYVNYTGTGNLILRLPDTGNTNTSWITIYNYSLNGSDIIVASNFAGRILTGRFGSSSASISLKNNQWIKVAFNTTDSNWYVVEKSFVNPVEFIPANFVANSINTPAIPTTNVLTTTQVVSYANTIIRASNNAFGTAIIADTVYKPFNCSSNFYFENTGNFNINLQLVSDATFTLSTNTFGGSYGSGTNSLIIPPRTYVQIFIPISNASAVWIVQLRVPDPTYEVAYSGTTITAYANSQYFNSTINLTGTSATIFNLPDPRQSVNPWATNKFIRINNNGSALITLNSTSGNFLGAHGNGFTTTILPDSSTFYLTSDGTNWNINERSSDITFRNLGLASSGVSYANNNNYLSANLHLSLASAVGTITWLDATAQHSHLTTTKVYNVGLYQITLNATITTDGTFLGKYGSGSSSLIIPANTWVELFSDGTNWLVNDRSSENQFYYPTAFAGSTATIVDNFQYINAELHLTSTSDRTTTLTIPAVSASGAINQKYIIYNDNNISASPNGYQIILSSASNIIGPFLGASGTTFPISPGCKVELYNNGTNWVVSDLGNSQVLTPQFASGGTFNQTRPLPKYNIINRIATGPNLQVTLPTPLRSDIGNEIVVRLGIRVASGSIQMSSTYTNPVIPLFANQDAQASQTFGYSVTLQTIRLVVLQYAWAGSGTITTTSGSTVVTINTLTSGIIGPYCFLTVATSPVTTLQIDPSPVVSTTTGLGGTGVYQITGFQSASSSGGAVAFTFADAYYWTLC